MEALKNSIINSEILLTEDDATLLEQTAAAIKPKFIVEIGSYKGGSASILGKIAQDNNGRMICIEPEIRPEFVQRMVDEGLESVVEVIPGVSPWIELSFIKPIDYLFIDGIHFFRWVLADYHYWEPFVKVGGRIAFHDFAENKQNEVFAAVHCICVTDPLLEIARTNSSSGDGGLIVFEKKEPSGQRLRKMKTAWRFVISDPDMGRK